MPMSPRLLRPLAPSGDSDVRAYIAAVEAADTQPLEQGIKDAYRDFIVGCKSDGIWDALDQCCILAGARTLAGALVPLKGSAPTNNNFVSGDYDRETGLKGNGTNKNLVLAKASEDFPAKDFANALYVTEGPTIDVRYLLNSFNNLIIPVSADISFRLNIAASINFGAALSAPTFIGSSRLGDASAELQTLRANGSTVTSTTLSAESVGSNDYRVFSRDINTAYTDARIAFYNIGTHLDLEDLDARVSALITAIGAAI